VTADEKILLNDRLTSADEACICPLDRGFLYGEGFFETTRVFAGRPFALSMHLERLQHSCEWAEWDRVPRRARIERGVERLIEANDVRDGYLRISVSQGSRAGEELTLLIQAHDLDLPPPGEAELITLSKAEAARAEDDPLVAHKSLSYCRNILSLRRAKNAGADEVYFLNHAGQLAEGAISNLFFVRGETVHTPAVNCGLLPGIARKLVLQLCRRHNIAFRTGKYLQTALMECDEAFCTNSLRGIMPVSGLLDGTDLRPAPGELTSTLQALYAERVRMECAEGP